MATGLGGVFEHQGGAGFPAGVVGERFLVDAQPVAAESGAQRVHGQVGGLHLLGLPVGAGEHEDAAVVALHPGDQPEHPLLGDRVVDLGDLHGHPLHGVGAVACGHGQEDVAEQFDADLFGEGVSHRRRLPG